MRITSLQNPKIKNLVKLRRRHHRDRQRRMLIDGGRALRLALQNDVPLEAIYFVPEQADAGLLARARQQGIPLQPVSDAVFQKIGYGDNPDGLLGVAPQPPLRLQD
ncbi:MAG: RNA methyltransferase, partial [Caldilineae bacterium]